MWKENRKKLGLLFCFFCLVFALQAQYTIRGGAGTPLLANSDIPKLEVWLVHGMENVEISYTSTSSSHQWYRYRMYAIDSEPIACEQNGTTSTIRDIQEGYGYYVDEGSLAVSHFIWIADYKKYAFEIETLSVEEGSDPCQSVYLKGDWDVSNIIFYTPEGRPNSLKRKFDLSYYTLEWSESEQVFVRKHKEQTIEGNPFDVRIDSVFTDTEFLLKGDQFARHFDCEQIVGTETYMTKMLYVLADTTQLVDEYTNMSSIGDGLNAPVTIRFSGYGNEPVASLYIWKIYNADDPNGSDNPIIRFPGQTVEHTFREAGNFIAELEVSDRSSSCTDNTQLFQLQIADSFLDIPNAFSPGTTPGINDEFRVAYKSLVRFQGYIYNRWGVEMFRWNDPSKGWDGKKNGKYVSPGVYFYIIEAEGSDKKKYKRKGDINILRPKMIDDEPIN